MLRGEKSKRKYLNTLDVDKGAPLKGKILIQMFEKASLEPDLVYLAIRQLGEAEQSLLDQMNSILEKVVRV